MNLGSLPGRHGRYRPDHEALVIGTNRQTFHQFERRTARLHAGSLVFNGAFVTMLPAMYFGARVGAKYQRVGAVVILDDFPRSTAGKTLKRALRAPYWADRSTAI